ncbi:sensor domain-containing diguanylate cyclase [Psychromonas sp. MB-3u-54]|uniref:sensor domain-containing diguanylate cyclase n=1 Tax=Psychromonas sp. MB-3u-54 TaxID=2058319 RepID=UPI0018E2A736|nr:sensor domain-containing diguanylate cyclase [Psychromonas sp. MB-3u-54]
MQQMNNMFCYGQIIIANNVVVSVNQQFVNILGFSSLDEMYAVQPDPLAFIAADYSDEVLIKSEHLNSGSFKTHGNVIYCTNKQGQKIAVFVLAQKINWEEQPALELQIFDISLKVSPLQLMNQPKYESLVEHSDQGVIIHRDFKPLLVNQVWIELMAAKSAQHVMENLNILDIIPTEFHAQAIDRYNKVIAGEAIGESHIIENIRFDGERRFLNIYDHAIHWQGEPAVEVVIVDVTDKVMAEKQLAYKAFHDSLTDLYNREAIYKWIREDCSEVNTMSCMLIDLDNFKRVNDTYGHSEGDGFLKRFAELFKEAIADHGVIGRWGGEEFIVFVPDRDKNTALALAEKIRLACAQTPLLMQGKEIITTVSIGVSYTDSFTQIQPKDIIRQADEKMYLSKSSGKNRVTS